MVFQKILDKITPEKEELSISWEQADKVYRDRKASELENIDKREDKLSKKTEELIETLGDSLEAFDNYDDSKDLQIVEDVAQNLYRTRKRMVQNFKTSKDIEQQAQDLEDFLEELMM